MHDLVSDDLSLLVAPLVRGDLCIFHSLIYNNLSTVLASLNVRNEVGGRLLTVMS